MASSVIIKMVQLAKREIINGSRVTSTSGGSGHRHHRVKCINLSASLGAKAMTK
jgi:hypothetical protein